MPDNMPHSVIPIALYMQFALMETLSPPTAPIKI